MASNIDTRASGGASSQAIPVVVFNSLGWARTDVAQIAIGFSRSGVTSLRMIDPGGRETPVQIVGSEEYAAGGLKNATVAFIARDVPAMGYSVYQILPEKSPPPSGQLHNPPAANSPAAPANTERQDTGSIENEYYRATFDLWNGALTRLDVKTSGGTWNAIGDRAANVVAEEQDGGDFWELYGTLNGGRFTAMTRKQGLPIPGQAHFSNEWVGGDGATDTGPVFAQFQISHPFGNGKFSTCVRLYRGVQRVDIETRVVNNDKRVRYRLLVPTSIASGKRFDEIPFGSVERPPSQEFPAQNWMDWGDGTRGVALLNRGLPGNNVSSGALLLSLMRSAVITAYSYSGGYEPGVSSDLGLELGEERTFDYALVPHNGDWRDSRTYRAGLEFNNPLIARKTSRHAGPLPSQWGLVEITPANVVASALKTGEDGGVILRVYEAAGKAAPGAKIKLPHGSWTASEVNLIERPLHDAKAQNDSLTFNLRPFEIKTFRIELPRAH